MYNTVFWDFGIFSWRDCVEILFLSYALYGVSLWLQRDFQKPLLLYFYGYCLLFFTTHYAHLSTIHSLLLTLFPICALIFILLHQDTLQRNFVMLRNITPAEQVTEHWTELLIRSSLVAASNNKEIRCIIEKGDSLSTILTCPVKTDCHVNPGLLDLLIESSLFKQHAMLWLNKTGRVQGINCLWKKTSLETWLAQELKEREEWIQDALFFTSKTDALFFILHPTTRTYTLIAQGKLLERISAHAALKTIKQYLGLLVNNEIKGDLHVHKGATHASEQFFT